MGLIAKSGGADYEPIPAGMHTAICFAVYDLGSHLEKGAGWEKVQRKVRIVWEIPELRIQINGKDLPRAKMADYTLTLNEKGKLRPMLEGWRGKPFTDEELAGFDLEKLLGVACQILIVHNPGKNGTVYDNIQTIVPAPKGYKGKPENPLKFFSLDDGDSDLEGIPEKTKEKIMASQEWQKTDVAMPVVMDGDPAEEVTEEEDDNLPF